MVQSKILLFLGRQDADTGYAYCVELAYRNNWQLGTVRDSHRPEVEIAQADYVFAGGYLVALEAMAHKKIVLAYYDNPVKKDYWRMHPMAKHIGLNGEVPVRYSEQACNWAKLQTWDKLAGQYEELWQG